MTPAKADLDDLSTEQLAEVNEYFVQVEAMQQWRCDRLVCDGEPHEGRWTPHARDKQVPPMLRPVPDQPTFIKRVSKGRQRRWYRMWYARAGRRWGKTWAGARALAELIAVCGGYDYNGVRRAWWVCGTTWDYTIKTLMESPSGLISALGGWDGPMLGSRREAWNRSEGILTCKNGAQVFCTSAHDGGKHLQGDGYSGGWGDEFGLWNRKTWETTWEDSLLTSTAVEPRAIIGTGTPKRGHPLVKRLLDDNEVFKVRGSMDENTSLSEDYRRERREQLGNSARGLQELDGEYLEDVDGAVWTARLIEDGRVTVMPGHLHEFSQIVISWDPSGGGTDGDEHGITVGGTIPDTGDGRGDQHYLLEDASFAGSHQEAAETISRLGKKWGTNLVVIEKNGVGAGMPTILLRHDPTLTVRTVHAPPGYGKQRRAEDVVALYEAGRAHHVGEFPLLEQEQTTWTPESSKSPNRLDSVVWLFKGLAPAETGGTGGVFVFDD